MGLKCPLCGNMMHEDWDLNNDDKHPKFYICFNEVCSFYGMLRMNKDYYIEVLERE